MLILDLGPRAQATNFFVDLDQFPAQAEENLVIRQLPPILGDRVVVGVEWHDGTKTFVRKTA